MSDQSNPETPQETIQQFKQGEAPKLSLRHGGSLTYEIGRDSTNQELNLRITGNLTAAGQVAGGQFSKEWLPLEQIVNALNQSTEATITSAALQIFRSKSRVNGGFLKAVLIAEGILTSVEGKPHQHVKGHPVADWIANLVATAETVASDPSPKPSGCANPGSRTKKGTRTKTKRSSLFDEPNPSTEMETGG